MHLHNVPCAHLPERIPGGKEGVAMAFQCERSTGAIGPFHAVFLAATTPLFLGALLSDIAYAKSYEIQWSNFASWLLVGAMVLASIALLCGIIEFFSGRRRPVYLLVLVAIWIVRSEAGRGGEEGGRSCRSR